MNKIFIGDLVGVFISLFAMNAFGQISQGGVPYSMQISSDEAVTNERKTIFSREIPTLEMTAISKATIEELKANNNKQDISYQFAYSFDVSIDFKKSALKDSIDCGFLYRLALKSSIEHCNTNQLNFNHASLPSGVYYVKLSMGINIVTKKVIIQ